MTVILASSLIASLAIPIVGQSGMAKPPLRACALLTRDLVAKYDTQNPKLREMFKPTEESVGAHGSSCDDGGIFLQVDPFARPDELRKSPGKDWHPVAGIGDAAFFRDNGGRWAELMAWTGSHHFTLQIGIPAGGTAELVKPNAAGLATALIGKLKAH